MRLVLIAISCCVLTGCIKKSSDKKNAAYRAPEKVVHKKKIFDLSDIERQEAALLDIAIPSYQQRLPLFCEDQYTGQVVLGYQSDCDQEAHRKFLYAQMERYGWNLRREFKGPELLLEFEKPTRSCAYSIRPRIGFLGKSKGTDVVIYVEDSGVVY